MKTIARKAGTGRCDRCGHVLLLDSIKDPSGRQMLLCERCTTIRGIEGLTDPLKNISWIKK